MDKGLQRALYKDEIGVIKTWLKANDWIPNKIVVGEWTKDDPRWIKYIEERTSKRNRLDELEALINGK